MANYMLTMPYMTSILHQAKSHYTITDKSTGEVLGYAFMLVDGQVTPNQVQLLPWQTPGGAPVSSQDRQPPPMHAVDDDMVFKGRLAIDLDISQDSSMNATVEEEFSSPSSTDDMKIQPDILTNPQVDLNANVSQYQSSAGSVNVKEDDVTKHSDNHNSKYCSQVTPYEHHPPSSALSVKSVTQSLAAQIAAKLMGGEATKDSSNGNIVDKDVVAGKSYKEAANVDIQDGQVVGKRKSNADVKSGKKVYCEKKPQYTPGQMGKYTAFYSYVGVAQPADKKHRRVRCLLCEDGTTLSTGNFGGHVKAFHELPVKCTVCGKEFSASTISVHKKKCVWQNMNFVEVNEKDKVLRQIADPELSPIQDSVVTLFPPIHISSSSSVPVKDTNPSFSSSKDYLSSSVESHPTSHSHPVLSKGCNKERSGGDDGITFTLSSATVDGVGVKIGIMKAARIKKVMKKFGKKLNVEIHAWWTGAEWEGTGWRFGREKDSCVG